MIKKARARLLISLPWCYNSIGVFRYWVLASLTSVNLNWTESMEGCVLVSDLVCMCGLLRDRIVLKKNEILLWINQIIFRAPLLRVRPLLATEDDKTLESTKQRKHQLLLYFVWKKTKKQNLKNIVEEPREHDTGLTKVVIVRETLCCTPFWRVCTICTL